jgi:hypothetical protein
LLKVQVPGQRIRQHQRNVIVGRLRRRFCALANTKSHRGFPSTVFLLRCVGITALIKAVRQLRMRRVFAPPTGRSVRYRTDITTIGRYGADAYINRSYT